MVVQKKYTEEELSQKTVKELRKVISGRGVHGVWVAGASKKALIKAILEGGRPNMLQKDILNDKTVLAMRGLAEVFAEMVMDAMKERGIKA